VYSINEATHEFSRFQHSLGVAHLAFEFASSLRKQHPDLVDEKDVLCVMLAGLCHDLGHGPFSHLWEFFVREAGKEWHHETSSVQMFDHLIAENNLMPIFAREAGLDKKDVLFIKELIAGIIYLKSNNSCDDLIHFYVNLSNCLNHRNKVQQLKNAQNK
jgi:HD superfamily phosphohydrolase